VTLLEVNCVKIKSKGKIYIKIEKLGYKEFKITKVYHSIGEVAEMFEVNTSLIRFWEKEFSIIKPKKNKKGNRLFTEKDIENFKIIYHLVKEKGYTLDGAKNELKSNKKALRDKFELINKLKFIRESLINMRD